ncbi:hypothetical protein [Anaeromassilibacillus sp. An200]|uniref:hypothetical protein n=1 Tax=Anaeromassilibacillus sp. An200 TaxID=1965587 RepID=UPI000B39480E|nr:hypothetical protein [Anaeromassilibacillus sp. An200]OUP06733.1 hypothetical protein B5F35_15095 [Anaeromassilibacillus sp. An200]
MKTLPISAGKNEIKNLVIEWNELLAQEKYSEALDLILYDDTQQIDGEEWIWTPERLETAVFTYGQPWYSKEDMKQLYGLDYSIDSKVTSLLTDSDKENRLENIKISIDFFDDVISADKAEIWGISKLNYKNIIGEIFFDGIPIDGERSDLTALFWIIRVSKNDITLVFRDLHMM